MSCRLLVKKGMNQCWHLMCRVILYCQVNYLQYVSRMLIRRECRRVENVDVLGMSTCRECVNVLGMCQRVENIRNFQKTLENSKSQKKSFMLPS